MGLKKNAIIVFLFSLILIGIAGCAMMGAKPYSEMTPKERATYVLSTYNQQYELYLKEATAPNLSESKKEILRKKKELMVQMYPYIGTYANYAKQGAFAPEDVEMALMKIMDKLLQL
jgi:hypothetical protein